METKKCVEIPYIQKAGTSHFPVPPGMARFMNAYENHPSLIAGVEALYAYQMWVARVVMPIAFQWIEEHYNEVYEHIEKKNEDDVGVVIAAAFELVQQTEAYKEGLEHLEQYKRELANGTLKTENLNPVWTRITEKVRKATDEAFEAEKKYLDDTI